MSRLLQLLLLLFLLPSYSWAQNSSIDSFRKAKKILLEKVYFDHLNTLYCGAQFTRQKKSILPAGFVAHKQKKRAERIEWEHVVPAENFGRNFSEWRQGAPRCVNKKGKPFKGRRCAERSNKQYRYMQADLYNLYPAIGSVNALRSNYNFTILNNEKSDFGSCRMKIAHHRVEPPARARGKIARSYLYMEWAYKEYAMSRQQRQLIQAWDREYPVSKWECIRAERIHKIQGNSNPFVERHCRG